MKPAIAGETGPRRIPVVEPLPSDFAQQVRSAEWDESLDRFLAHHEARCIAFKATGRHEWQRDTTPTFMCARPASKSWIGYGEHCASPMTPYVDRFGQHDDERCGVTRLPDAGCVICSRPGEYLCDAPRCDVPLCDTHRIAGFRGMDFCPEHGGLYA